MKLYKLILILLTATQLILTLEHPNLLAQGRAPSFIKVNHGTRVSEIIKWDDLSDQYTLGYGYDENRQLVPFAVYDKTFSTPFYSHFWKILILGSLGISDLNLAALSKQLTNPHPTLTTLPEASIYISKDFWKNEKIIWKSGKKPKNTKDLPKTIYSSDFNWNEIANLHEDVNQALTAFRLSSAELDQNEELPLTLDLLPDSQNILKNIAFHREPNGTYKVYSIEKPFIRPVKVIDLKNKYSSFAKAASWAAVTNIIKGGLNAVPIYGAPQAAGAMLERVFDFIEILYLNRHGQALNLVLEAIDGNLYSPFNTSKLSKKQLEAATFYLLRSQSMLGTVFKNLFTKNDDIVKNFLTYVHYQKELSIANLEKRGVEVFPLAGSYFALGLQRNESTGIFSKQKIYTLPYPKMFRPTQPHAAVDFLHPNREKRRRQILQAVLMVANFIYVPVPAVGTIIKMAYKEIVIREFHRRAIWENGLLAHIHHNPIELRELLKEKMGISEKEAEEYQQLAISTIEDRRLNPLDLNEAELSQHREKVERWIKKRDLLYRSWSEMERGEGAQKNPLPESL